MLLVSFLLLIVYGCSTNEVQEQELTFELQNQLVLYSGVEAEKDTRYNIGVLFDEVSDQKARELVNNSFGDGPYSLFNTLPFSSNKDKFNVYYGTIPPIMDANQVGSVSEELEKNVIDSIQQNIQNIHSTSDLDIYLKPLKAHLSNSNHWTNKQKKAFDEFGSPNYYYLDYLSIEESISNNRPLGELGRTIQNNISQFTEIFDKYSFLNCRFHISKGISQGYASFRNKNVYSPLFTTEDNLIHRIQYNFHEDYTAITSVHEFGHVFADLVDEYYPYGGTESSNKVKKNCYGNMADNPWTNIPNYNTNNIYEGACGGASFRGTLNSIMRHYFLLLTPEDWHNGWGIINSYYIQQMIDSISN